MGFGFLGDLMSSPLIGQIEGERDREESYNIDERDCVRKFSLIFVKFELFLCCFFFGWLS